MGACSSSWARSRTCWCGSSLCRCQNLRCIHAKTQQGPCCLAGATNGPAGQAQPGKQALQAPGQPSILFPALPGKVGPPVHHTPSTAPSLPCFWVKRKLSCNRSMSCCARHRRALLCTPKGPGAQLLFLGSNRLQQPGRPLCLLPLQPGAGILPLDGSCYSAFQ
jgi:hypothetical protein